MSDPTPAVHGTTHPRWFGAVGALVTLVAAVGLFAGIGALRATPQNSTFGIVGIVGFVVAIAGLVGLGKLVARELVVDEDGIESRTRAGAVTRIRWSEPHDFHYRAMAPVGLAKAMLPKIQKVSVRAPDGRRIDIDNVRVRGAGGRGNFNAELPELVQRYSTAANWPRIVARLRAGEDVAFGKLRMNIERVQVGAVSLPLGRPLAVRVVDGRIELQAEGKWFASKVWVRQVANYPCFLRALEERAIAA